MPRLDLTVRESQLRATFQQAGDGAVPHDRRRGPTQHAAGHIAGQDHPVRRRRHQQFFDIAAELAAEGKTRTSDALSSLGKIVADNAGTIDEKLGARYGDYARTAARSLQEAGVKLEGKELGELGEDAKQLAKKNPGVALGLAAVVGFMLARLFSFAND